MWIINGTERSQSIQHPKEVKTRAPDVRRPPPDADMSPLKSVRTVIDFEQKYSQKIFQLFQRLLTPDPCSGTGIGSAICKKIVENYNGFIVASGNVDEGSAFTLILPQE